MTEELLTFRDAYEHLLDHFNLVGKDTDTNVRNLRRALTEAYRKLPVLHDWRYFARTTAVTTDATYSTGTITYTSSTNRVVLSGGTWPANAAYGHLIIAEIAYKIARRIDDTTLELDEHVKPNADLAAGTAYRWGRYRYLLPVDVGDIREVLDGQLTLLLNREGLSDVFWRNLSTNTQSYPTTWTMVRSEDYPGRWELWLSSVDSTVRELRVLYDARFSSLPIEEISDGTVSVTGDIVTFSEAVLTEDCVGCVLRIGTGSDKPTPAVGSWIDADTGFVTRLPETSLILTQFTTSTTGVLSRPLSSPVTDRGYSLSSLADVNPSGMWELFLRLCEQHYNIITRASGENRGVSATLVKQALREAAIADARRIEGVGFRSYGVSPVTSNDAVT